MDRHTKRINGAAQYVRTLERAERRGLNVGEALASARQVLAMLAMGGGK